MIYKTIALVSTEDTYVERQREREKEGEIVSFCYFHTTMSFSPISQERLPKLRDTLIFPPP